MAKVIWGFPPVLCCAFLVDKRGQGVGTTEAFVAALRHAQKDHRLPEGDIKNTFASVGGGHCLHDDFTTASLSPETASVEVC